MSRTLQRLLLAAAAVLVVGAGFYVNVVKPGGGEDSDRYEVDVVFDTAKSIIPGQVVKIAGARVGRVKDVNLTPERKARMTLSVEKRFAPFHANAACTIKPEGLLSENFVQCDPGTSTSPALEGKDGTNPTVPVDRTTLPVSLNDLFGIWNVPTRERLRLLVNELGIAGAGRGEELNALLRRSNPALASARKVLTILHDQEKDLTDSIDATDAITRELGRKPENVSAFIDNTAKVAARTADRSRDLATAVDRLPELLDATKPALTRFTAVAEDARPVLKSLRQSAPALASVTRGIPPLARAATPTVKTLPSAISRARVNLTKLGTSIKLLASFAPQAAATGVPLEQLLTNLRERGALEYLLKFSYYNGVLLARYDKYSHLLPGYLLIGACSPEATAPVEGCDSHIGPVVGGPTALKQTPARQKKTPSPQRPAQQTKTPALQVPQVKVPEKTQERPQLKLPGPLSGASDAVNDLLDFLLKP